MFARLLFHKKRLYRRLNFYSPQSFVRNTFRQPLLFVNSVNELLLFTFKGNDLFKHLLILGIQLGKFIRSFFIVCFRLQEFSFV